MMMMSMTVCVSAAVFLQTGYGVSCSLPIPIRWSSHFTHNIETIGNLYTYISADTKFIYIYKVKILILIKFFKI